jgi:hypothetical protein
MRAKIFRYVKIAAALLGMILLTFLAVRVYDTQRGPALKPWHTHVPHELHVERLETADWSQYLAAEAAIFDDVQREVSGKLAPADRVPANRYFEGSPVYPGALGPGLQPLIRAPADGKTGRCRRASARPDGLPL